MTTPWPEVPLGEVCEVLSGFAFDSAQFGDSGDLPIVRIRDVVGGSSRTYYRGLFDERFIVNDGDLLVGMDGEFNRATWRGGRALLNQRVSRISVAHDRLDERYLFHLLPAALKRIEDRTAFVTVKHLSIKTLREIALPLPPIEEQRRIAAVLDRADELRAKRRASLALLDSLTESIFLDMFGDPAERASEWPTVRLGDIATDTRLGTSIKSGPTGRPTLRIPNVKGGDLDLDEIHLVDVSDADLRRLRLVDGDLLFVRSNGNPDYKRTGRVGHEMLRGDRGLEDMDTLFSALQQRAFSGQL